MSNTNDVVLGVSKDAYKRINGEWVRQETYRHGGGEWVFHDEYVMTADEEMPNDCLTFSRSKPFDISVYNSTKNWDGTLYYSTDAKTWNEWDGTTAINSAKHGFSHRIYMRGKGNSVITGKVNGSAARWDMGDILFGAVSCHGNIENLLDYETVQKGEHPVMAEWCFACMFYYCNLSKAPELPATTLSAYCYYDMFFYCHDLTKAPALPATTLEKECYYGMFEDCTDLTEAPELPATVLAEGCYGKMFADCDNLAIPPALPATTLAKNCYYEMFYNYNRRGITEPPELPATTLAEGCYESMFYKCGNLTKAPALPATTLADDCYYNMFYECSNLTQIPELPATTLADSCYCGMFKYCSKVKLSKTQEGEYQTPYRIPTSGDGTEERYSILTMFESTGGTFKGSPSINTTYYTSNVVVPSKPPVASKYLYGKEVESAPYVYYYGDIPVPEAPLQWDKEKYPYAYMNYLRTPLEDGRIVEYWAFVAGEQPALAKKTDDNYYPYSPSKCVVMAMANQAYFDLWGQSDKYVEGWQTEEKNYTNSIYLGNIYWANHDVKCNDSENIFISAGEEPTELTVSDGFHEINGTYYYGEILPNIDSVWTDKAKYPYATISVHDFSLYGAKGKMNVLYLTPVMFDGSLRHDISGETVFVKMAVCALDQDSADTILEGLGMEVPIGEWVVAAEEGVQEGYLEPMGVVKYASYDILNSDGSIYLAATEPIPIYE